MAMGITMDRQLVSLAIGMVAITCADAAAARTGPYVQMGLGAALAPPLTVHGSDDDWGTRCDLIINPSGLEVGNECDAAPPRSSWTNDFDGGSGIAASLAFGYDRGQVRIEIEYFHRGTVFGDSDDLIILDDVTLDKQDQEIELAVGTTDDLRSHGLFANLFYDFGAEEARWTPYVGAGIGVERATLDYGTIWKRNDDPERITTFMDPALRAKLAGTTTIGDARLTDTLMGYQLLAGVDYRLRDPVMLGVQFRWVTFGEFESDPTPWNQLRSHESSVGRGEMVRYQVTTDDSRFWSIGINLKYGF